MTRGGREGSSPIISVSATRDIQSWKLLFPLILPGILCIDPARGLECSVRPRQTEGKEERIYFAGCGRMTLPPNADSSRVRSPMVIILGDRIETTKRPGAVCVGRS